MCPSSGAITVVSPDDGHNCHNNAKSVLFKVCIFFPSKGQDNVSCYDVRTTAVAPVPSFSQTLLLCLANRHVSHDVTPAVDGRCLSLLGRGFFSPLKPSGHYTYHRFNNQQFCVLPTQCVYVFCVDLRTNSDYFPIQH